MNAAPAARARENGSRPWPQPIERSNKMTNDDQPSVHGYTEYGSDDFYLNEPEVLATVDATRPPWTLRCIQTNLERLHGDRTGTRRLALREPRPYETTPRVPHVVRGEFHRRSEAGRERVLDLADLAPDPLMGPATGHVERVATASFVLHFDNGHRHTVPAPVAVFAANGAAPHRANVVAVKEADESAIQHALHRAFIHPFIDDASEDLDAVCEHHEWLCKLHAIRLLHAGSPAERDRRILEALTRRYFDNGPAPGRYAIEADGTTARIRVQ